MARSDGRREYRNTTRGFVGVVKMGRNGEEKGMPVGPGERVFLSDDEVQLTKDAQKDPSTSPFSEQPFETRDPETNRKVVQQRALLVPVDEAGPEPEPEPEPVSDPEPDDGGDSADPAAEPVSEPEAPAGEPEEPAVATPGDDDRPPAPEGTRSASEVVETPAAA